MAVAALVVGLILVVRDDGDDSSGVPSTDGVGVPATLVPPTDAADVSPPATATPSTSGEPTVTGDVSTAIWPWVDTDVRFHDPVAAATSFANDYIGFVDPIVGTFQQGDARSGEVTVEAFDGGPATVVLVRQLTSDGSWWVLGAAAEHITVDEPDADSVVASPLTVSGTAEAFEGTAEVELRADGSNDALFEGFVTGGSTEMGPYSETFDWSSPATGAGALVLFSRSAEDGSVVEASALRVFFG